MKRREKKSLDAKVLEKVINAVKEADDTADNAQSYEVAEESDANDVAAETPIDTAEAKISELCAENELLKDQLKTKEAEYQKIISELKELTVRFPKRRLESIGEEVFEQLRMGVSLAEAFAVSEQKREASEKYAEEVNTRNAERSSGAISSTADGGYYSPDEVRKMTAYEVKKNYNLIIESMKKWN